MSRANNHQMHQIVIKRPGRIKERKHNKRSQEVFQQQQRSRHDHAWNTAVTRQPKDKWVPWAPGEWHCVQFGSLEFLPSRSPHIQSFRNSAVHVHLESISPQVVKAKFHLIARDNEVPGVPRTNGYQVAKVANRNTAGVLICNVSAPVKRQAVSMCQGVQSLSQLEGRRWAVGVPDHKHKQKGH